MNMESTRSAPAVQPLLVREMVARQMRTTTAAIYRVITYVSLATLVLVSAAFAAVQVWALRGYLPGDLPAPAAWALPVALQVLVLAAELILLSSAVTRSRAVQVTAGAVMALGYGAEITAHVHHGGSLTDLTGLDLVTVTMVVMSVLLALSWTLLALALRAGIADADALVQGERASAPEPIPAEPLPAPLPARPDTGLTLPDDWFTDQPQHGTLPQVRPAYPAADSTRGRIDVRIEDQIEDQDVEQHDEHRDDDRLGEEEARRRIEEGFRNGWSTRKTGEYATRSATLVSRVYRELRSQSAGV